MKPEEAKYTEIKEEGGKPIINGANAAAAGAADADGKEKKKLEVEETAIVAEERTHETVRHREEFDWPSNDQDAKSIVVIGADNSKETDYAFDWYMRTVHRKENLVVVVHALSMRSKPSLFFKHHWELETAHTLEVRDALHEKFRTKFKELQLRGAILSDCGEPGHFILQEAKNLKADMIVTGTRDTGLVKRAFLGSVSDYVFNHAQTTVLICRKEHK